MGGGGADRECESVRKRGEGTRREGERTESVKESERKRVRGRGEKKIDLGGKLYFV